jgi:RNA polymerase sigma factor (sigma-70 family)
VPLTENNESGYPAFVRVVCSPSVVNLGLASVLAKAAIPHGPNPPHESVPYCTVLCVHAVEDLPEAIDRAQEESDSYPILVLAPQNDLKLAEASLRAGARGFVHAEMRPEQILRALSVVSRGELVAPRELLESVLENGGISRKVGQLSPRQREILELVVTDGLTNAQIAERLFLTESTVKQHLRLAYKILEVKNRAQAAQLIRGAG